MNIFRNAGLLLAAIIGATVPAIAQRANTLPIASPLNGSERIFASQGAGCATNVAPCASVSVQPPQIATFLAPTFQPKDTDLDAIAALATIDYGRQLLAKGDAATVRGYLGAAASADVQVFTTSGTWIKPANARTVRVIVKGAGSGGASGRRGADATVRTGGSGGAGGAYVEATLQAVALGTSEPVTVGVGSAGGASITADNTNGNASLAGGLSSFGAWAVARGGNVSQPGSASPGSGSSGAIGVFPGGSGGSTSVTAGSIASSTTWAGGGAAGGSITAANAVITLGASGAPTATSLAGANPGQPGTSQGYASTGGGSGIASLTADGGTGGAGILGSGGGGGAASVNGFASGAGGRGGDGIVVILTSF